MAKFDFETFNPGKPNEFETYIERLDCTFLARETADDKKVHVLLSVIGSETYMIAKNLTAPALPSTKTYNELVNALRGYFTPRVNVVAQRFRFHKRCQNSDESVTAFMNSLRYIASTCEFGAFLNDALRDQFVCGLFNADTQRKCLTETNITLENAFNLAVSMESASAGLSIMKPDPVIARVSCKFPDRVPVPSRGKPKGRVSTETFTQDPKVEYCFRCLSVNHKANFCKHKSTVCNFCKFRGHLERACNRKKKNSDSFKVTSASKHSINQVSGSSNSLAESRSEINRDVINSVSFGEAKIDSQSQDSLNLVNCVGLNNAGKSPYSITMRIQGIDVNFLIDTGAAVSLVNKETWRRLGSFCLNKCSPRLSTYTGEEIRVLGTGEVTIGNALNEVNGCLTVVDSENTNNLLGQDLLQKFKIDWQSVHTVKCCSELNPISDVSELPLKYPDVFKKELGLLANYEAKLYLKPDAKPKFCKARTIAFGIKAKVEAEIKRLKNEGILEPVNFSEWATAIVPIQKSDGISVRICGDFKVTLNPQLCVEQYPMPNTNEILSKLAGTRYYSKIDLSQAFNQLKLDKDSQKLTVINTPWGLFKYTRLAFGISSSPSLFQRAMDNVLQGIPNVISRVDDILISTKTKEEHMSVLDLVFERLQKYNLRVRRDKCEFLTTSVKYLGHIISAEGIRPDPEKLQAIRDCKIPSNVTEVRALCGFVNYYSQYIPECSKILAPLYRLTKKNVQFRFDKSCYAALKQLQVILTNKMWLAHFDPDLPIKLTVDASPIGLGAVLSNVDQSGQELPVRFASRTLSKAESNYSQIEKESLAIIFGITKFHEYLFGNFFTIESDHKPLINLFGEHNTIPTIVASRLQRWAIKLAAYDYTIIYRKGEDNIADMLSRLPVSDKDPESENLKGLTEGDRVQIMRINSLPVRAEEVAKATREDPLLSKVLQFQKFGWPEEVSLELKPYHTKSVEFTIEKEVLLKGIRVVVPSKLRERVLEQLHDTHPGIQRMKGIARSHVWWPNIDRDIEKYVRNCVSCQLAMPRNHEATVHPLLWPSTPWYRLHIDYAGPFKGSYWLIVVDATSKWPEIVRIKEPNSKNTILALETIFSRFGYCEQIFSDNGSCFTSDEFRNYCEGKGIKLIFSSPWHARSNGCAERMVESFKNMVKKEDPAPSELDLFIARYLLNYRTSKHATTGRCPHEILFKLTPKTIMHRIHPCTSDFVLGKQLDQQDRSVSSQSNKQFFVGDRVLARDYRSSNSNKWILGTIVSRRAPLSFLVEVGQELWRRHADQLRCPGNGFMSDEPKEPLDSMRQHWKVETPTLTMHESKSNPVSTPEEPVGTPKEFPSQPEEPVQTPMESTSQQKEPIIRRYPMRERKPPDYFINTDY